MREGVRHWEGIYLLSYSCNNNLFTTIKIGTQFKASLVKSLYEKYLKKQAVHALKLAVRNTRLREELLSWKNHDERGMTSNPRNNGGASHFKQKT